MEEQIITNTEPALGDCQSLPAQTIREEIAEEKAQKGVGGGWMQRCDDGKDEWLTPPELIVALAPFDLDPCAPIVRPWPTAAKHYTIEDDGLKQPWAGRVWLNPPFDRKAMPKFMSKMAEHNNGIALLCARTETILFFEHVWPVAHSITFLKGRLSFYHVTGEKAANCQGAPSCLIAYGEASTLRIAQAIENKQLTGRLLVLNNWETGPESRDE